MSIHSERGPDVRFGLCSHARGSICLFPFTLKNILGHWSLVGLETPLQKPTPANIVKKNVKRFLEHISPKFLNHIKVCHTCSNLHRGDIFESRSEHRITNFRVWRFGAFFLGVLNFSIEDFVVSKVEVFEGEEGSQGCRRQQSSIRLWNPA